MQITVELSFYPLHQSFGSQILEFIGELKGDERLRIRTNSLSTQISGDFETVMQQVTRAVKRGFSAQVKAVVVMKMFNEALELEWVDLNH
jgi:uncharacterized protein YqgV (UPF0045/DUF77 family)